MEAKLKNIFSMVVFGTIAVFVKNIALSTGEIALYRAIIASFAIGIYLIVLKKKIVFNEIKKDIFLLFLSGAAMGFNWIFLFEAYNYTAVSIATLSYYFAPVIVMIVSPILFKEKMTVKQIICFIMATLGLIMVIGVGSLDKSSNNLLGIGFGIGAAVLYATVILLNKFIKNVTGLDRTLVQFIAAIIILFPYVLNTTGINIITLDTSGLLNLLILGIFHTGLTYCLYFSSIKDLKGQEAAILSYIDPLVAIIISVVLLRESISGIQILGGAMILGFTILNEINIKPGKSLVVEADNLKENVN